MATQYPGKIDDNTSLPDVIDNGTPLQAIVINRLKQAILAIESELGVKPGGVSTVKNRLTTIDASINSLEIIKLAKDLGGSLDLPQVIGLRGVPVANATPIAEQVLSFNGLTWIPKTLSSGESFTVAGDLSGNSLSQTVIKLQNYAVSNTAPTNNYILTWETSSSSWKPKIVPAILYTELYLTSGLEVTTSNSYVRAGARKIDLSYFPSTIGSLTRVVKFVVNVDKTSTATNATVQLYDNTNGVLITGTNLTSTSVSNTEVSATITAGSSSGNLRTDSAAQYELQLKMTGGSAGDSVACTSAYILITYA